MSPSTSKPQDAFKVPRVGTWTCLICVPNVSDRGGQREFYAHWSATHLTTTESESVAR